MCFRYDFSYAISSLHTAFHINLTSFSSSFQFSLFSHSEHSKSRLLEWKLYCVRVFWYIFAHFLRIVAHISPLLHSYQLALYIALKGAEERTILLTRALWNANYIIQHISKATQRFNRKKILRLKNETENDKWFKLICSVLFSEMIHKKWDLKTKMSKRQKASLRHKKRKHNMMEIFSKCIQFRRRRMK